MAKQLTQKQLTQIVSESVNKILKEWTDSEMPGLSKNPKVATAQNRAKFRPVGRTRGKVSDCWNHQCQSDGGEDKIGKPDLTALINTMQRSKDETEIRQAGEKFAMIMNKNKEVGDAVFYALIDIAHKHYNDFKQWNQR